MYIPVIINNYGVVYSLNKNGAVFATSANFRSHYINTGMDIFIRLKNAGSDLHTKTYHNSFKWLKLHFLICVC